MKINRYIIIIFFSLLLSNTDTLLINIDTSNADTLLTSIDTSNADTLLINTDTSKLNWIGKKVSGQHNGEILIKSGYVVISNGEILKAEVVVDMATISVLDIESPESNQNLVDHLKDDDFFNVDSFKTATLIIDSSENYKSELSPQYNVRLNGSLKIRDIINPVSFLSHVNLDKEKIRAIGTLIIDRTKWNIKYKSKSYFSDLGDKFIYDDFSLDFDLYVK